MLIRSGALDVLVIDSVAALVPRAEIEGEMGDHHVGLQARLMSQALRKLAGNLSKSRTTAIFINQLREKIGVMFGCLSWDTRVTLADGSQEWIGKIVNQRLPVEVLSYDPDQNKIVPRKVVNWFNNGRTEEFLHIQAARPSGRGTLPIFSCTPNHQVRTPEGWKEAQELKVGDRVLRSIKRVLSNQQWEVLLGGLMGDSALSLNKTGLAARLRWGHGQKQEEYGDWKASMFSNIKISRTTNSRNAVFWDLPPLAELLELRSAVYAAGKKVLSWDYLKRLTPLSLAIWYMDDGSFSLRSKGLQERTAGGSGRIEICVESLEQTSRERLRDHLADTWGIQARLTQKGQRNMAFFIFTTNETVKFQALVAPYVHPSMDYKLLPRFRNQFGVEPVTSEEEYELMPVPILKIDRTPPKKGRPHRFDIEVEGSHNYFAEGVMVHNSPETTPGGRALKFYSSVRLDIRRIETLKEGTGEGIGNRVRVKVAKNKMAPPFRKAEFDIMFGEGISREGSLLDIAVDEGVVRKSGAWFTFDDDQLGQGRENAKRFLKENPEIAMQLQDKVYQAVGLVDSPEAAEGSAEAETETVTAEEAAEE
jgi:recombination protein RecA